MSDIVEPPTNKTMKKEETNCSITVKARNSSHEIVVETKSVISNIPQVIDSIMDEISNSKLFVPEKDQSLTPRSLTGNVFTPVNASSLSQIELLSAKLEIDAKSLMESRLVGFKGDSFQIIKTSNLQQSEVGLLILAINEFVFHRDATPYQEWKTIFEASKTKGKLNSSDLVRNYKRDNRIEKEKYEKNQELVLTYKGLEDLKVAIRKLL